MSNLETSLAVLENATALASKVPYIGVIANILRQGLRIQSVGVPPLFCMFSCTDSRIRKLNNLGESGKQ